LRRVPRCGSAAGAAKRACGCGCAALRGAACAARAARQRRMSAAKRLKKEAEQLAEEDLDWCMAEPSGASLYVWEASVSGPEGSPYEGGLFNLEFKFPDNYPFKPPDVIFKTKVYHPSIKQDSGEICADILKNDWKPTLNIKWILTMLRQMLKEPSGTDSPLEPEIAQLLQEKPHEFAERAKKMTQKYAC
jgi:ubiquitin-conjugating enzyme E2 D/E